MFRKLASENPFPSLKADKLEDAVGFLDDIENIYVPPEILFIYGLVTQAAAICELLKHHKVQQNYNLAQSIYQRIYLIKKSITIRSDQIKEYFSEATFSLSNSAASSGMLEDAVKLYDEGTDIMNTFDYESSTSKIFLKRETLVLLSRVKAAFAIVSYYYAEFMTGKTSNANSVVDTNGIYSAMRYMDDIDEIGRTSRLIPVLIYWTKGATYMSLALRNLWPEKADLYLKQATHLLKSLYQSEQKREDIMEILGYFSAIYHKADWFPGFLSELNLSIEIREEK